MRLLSEFKWDLLAVAGGSALLYGVAILSEPAAWIVGGVLLLSVAVWGAKVWPS